MKDRKPAKAAPLTRQETLHQLLKRKHAFTNWNDLASIRAYNEYARMLRKELK